MSDEIKKAQEIAGQIAITEILRVLIANLCQATDEATSRANLAKFEELAVNGINSRRHFSEANDETETYIKEVAAGFVSRLVSSVNVEQ